MPAQGIPASQIANVIPGVLAAGGTGLDLVGLVLTQSTRPPIGQILSFASAQAVGNYFGFNANEYLAAEDYFLGFAGATITPAAMLFTQYPWAAAVEPYLRGGPIGAQLTLAQLKAIAPGALTITINGVLWTSSSINLASATSFSNAAATIATALAANDAAFTGVIAPETASVTASIAGTVMTVSVVGSGVLVVGGVLAGTGVTAGTIILGQITGTAGGVGTYLVSISQTVTSGTVTETWGQLTASSITGALAVGQIIAGSGVTAGSTITAPVSAGVWVTQTQTVGSESMTSGAATVTYDSVSEGFVINGGTPGAPGTITYAAGAIATALDLTAATGAVLSQGAAQASPSSFMSAIWNTFQNFGSFFTMFLAVVADEIAFAQWTNSLNTEVAYIDWHTDVANTLPNPTTTSTAQIIAAGYSGTIPIYAPINTFLDAAFISGCIASINFNIENGRTDLAFRTQAGLPAEVTSGTIATQLIANGLNFYGTYSTPSENFTWLYPGSVTGPYLWIDSYVDAIWLKNQLQNALMQLFGSVGNIPFNAAGYASLIEVLGGSPATNGQAAGPIQQALSFGAIRPGIVLSSTQIAALNNQAGPGAAAALTATGYYIQVKPATPAIRQVRGPLSIVFWWTDGESVQSVQLTSTTVL